MKPEDSSASRWQRVVIALTMLATMFSVRAANIVFVSDANDPLAGAGDPNTFRGFFPPGSGYSDSGFVTILQNAGHNVPGWLEWNPAQLTAKINALPTPEDVPFEVNMNLIIEFYR